MKNTPRCIFRTARGFDLFDMKISKHGFPDRGVRDDASWPTNPSVLFLEENSASLSNPGGKAEVLGVFFDF